MSRQRANKKGKSVQRETSAKRSLHRPPGWFGRWRERFVLSIFIMLSAGLLIRAGFLQIVDKDYLQSEGDARYLRIKKDAPLRGMIVDRHDNPLAISTPVDSIWGHPPTLLAQSGEYNYKKLLAKLGKSKKQFDALLRKNAKREFVYLKRHIAPADAQEILDLDIPGINKLREYRRYYPAGPVASHVLGFTNIDNEGQEGIELIRDQRLKGAAGEAVIMQDRVGHIVEKLEQLKPVKHGDVLQLSIDARIQYLAYRHLKNAVKQHRAASGSLVALDAKTGEILAMANVPDFNPNDRSDLKSSKFRNRAITDTFEPGSTIKPFTVAMALEHGVIKPHSVIDTSPGVMSIGRSRISDTKNLGEVDVATIIQKSSNIGAVKIATLLKPRHLVKVLDQLGFGHKTEVHLPGQQAGVLPKRRKWRAIEHATLSYGYGLSATTLQLAQAYTVFANDGRVLPVSLSPLSPDEVPVGEQVFSARTADQARTMMQRVVSSDGTARKAVMERYTAAGKTGTVHRLDPNGGGYMDDSYLSLFVGFAPVQAPEIVMAVVITDPRGEDYYGGKIAGPIFAAVMEGALRFRNVNPDVRPVNNDERKSTAAVQHARRELM